MNPMTLHQVWKRQTTSLGVCAPIHFRAVEKVDGRLCVLHTRGLYTRRRADSPYTRGVVEGSVAPARGASRSTNFCRCGAGHRGTSSAGAPGQ